MKDWPRMTLRRFVPMRVQEWRFNEGDEDRQAQQRCMVSPHYPSLISQKRLRRADQPIISTAYADDKAFHFVWVMGRSSAYP
jgi:hypothetical protein